MLILLVLLFPKKTDPAPKKHAGGLGTQRSLANLFSKQVATAASITNDADCATLAKGATCSDEALEEMHTSPDFTVHEVTFEEEKGVEADSEFTLHEVTFEELAEQEPRSSAVQLGAVEKSSFTHEEIPLSTETHGIQTTAVVRAETEDRQEPPGIHATEYRALPAAALKRPMKRSRFFM